MNIVYYEEPFYHIIVNDIFGEEEYNLIQKEIDSLISMPQTIENDQHHQDIALSNIQSWELDTVYKDRREDSQILKSTRRAFQIPFDRKKFPFADLLFKANSDHSMLHSYMNDSYYFRHTDDSFLTFLFNLWKRGEFEGGQLMFSDYDYIPKLEKNSLIIFPGNVVHQVNPLKGDGVDRVILNRRLWINQ